MLLAELLANSLIIGLLLGGFYAIVSIGLSISFGLMGVSNIAHPTFILIASYLVFLLNNSIGMDPIIGGAILAPPFFALGFILYHFYNKFFEIRSESLLMGLIFFFALLILSEMGLVLSFGTNYISTYTRYTMEVVNMGVLRIPFRLLYPFLAGLAATLALYFFFSKTFIGIAARAVAQDEQAAMLMGCNPLTVRRIAFGLSILTTAIAGGLLLAVQPVEPFLDRQFIGRAFAVVILGGMGSLLGPLLAGMVLGVVESFIAIFFGTGWSYAASFGILLLVLALKPSGLFRR
jgi:branched-chain amino acid transport system permease protein